MSKIRLSVDDACESDIRVAGLANEYGIETIFYWPIEWHSLALAKQYEPLRFKDALGIAGMFEIGAHTITHRYLTSLNINVAEYEICQSGAILQKLFETKVSKFCPPRGYTTPTLTRLALNYYEEQRLTRGQGLVHIHPNSGANGNRPWRECIDENTTEIWGHSWEFDKYNLWDELEEVLREGLHT